MLRSKPHFGWTLTAILAAALLVRLAAGVWWQQRLPAGQKFAFGDSESYWQLGRAIAHRQPYEYGPDHLQIFRTPGYPALLAPLFWFADDPPVLWARALSAVLSTVAVGLTGLLARALFDDRAALLAAAIAAIYPESIALGVFVLSEAGFAPCMMLNLLCWTLAWQASGNRQLFWSFSAGISAGLATLMRPSWLLFVPFALIAGALLLFVNRSQFPKLLKTTSLVFIGLFVAVVPWWLRNYSVAGRFIPTTLQVGASLYDGISPTATGASEMSFVGHFVAEQRAADAQSTDPPPGLFEDRLDNRLKQAAIDFARANPRRVLDLAGTKFLRMWSPVPNANEFQSRSLRLALLLTYTPLIVLAIFGVWRFSRRGWPYVLCWLPAIYLTCLHVIFVSSIRYRQPAMLPLIILAAGMLIDLLPRRVGSAHHTASSAPISTT
ncbi:MAG TPA: glycosyltransferase family 39 protein [Pirellulaceae bacterium]|jgi:4-amino-4-deoxy-L-arabinose transferase-like glycosyltransferase